MADGDMDHDSLIKLLLIGTNDMAADILTKSLLLVKHDCFCLGNY